MNFKLLKFFLITVGLTAGFQAQAVGLSVKPTQLDLELKKGLVQQAEILVVNVFGEPAWYQVYPDDFTDEIKISPADFKLYPQESQLVTVTVASAKAGRWATNISVVARPFSGAGLMVNPGVKVPVSIKVAGFWWWSFWWLGILLTCFVILVVVKLIMLYRRSVADRRRRL